MTNTDSAYAVTRIIDEELPTLILLPGVFRGFLKDEEFLKVLSRRKINWISWHTSRHPQSIMVSQTAAPWLRQVTTQDLAQELVILKQTLKIKDPNTGDTFL